MITITDNHYYLASAAVGIALVNRLRPGPTKARHASRVWSKYNEFKRAAA